MLVIVLASFVLAAAVGEPLQLCPVGTVQLAVAPVAMDMSGYNCAQAVGIAAPDLLQNKRLSTLLSSLRFAF
ncbi:Aste57867_4150 [Aphanomyces stellatus]|uniref:Aste57867_4150 protein n=1 Tax=Aphanomyces stellatus TaxID=120398 RepID=A0A485KCN6_9STRA|nr:hypothetical protein As57867_004139 [Aphanomyces stellatus]VFT81277.1 Aste57867_4150 [Aphanomyces stellatus]